MEGAAGATLGAEGGDAETGAAGAPGAGGAGGGGNLDVRDVFVSGAFALVGLASVELPVVLVLGCVLGMLYARRERSLAGGVLVSFLLLARVLMQASLGLYGLAPPVWLAVRARGARLRRLRRQQLQAPRS